MEYLEPQGRSDKEGSILSASSSRQPESGLSSPRRSAGQADPRKQSRRRQEDSGPQTISQEGAKRILGLNPSLSYGPDSNCITDTLGVHGDAKPAQNLQHAHEEDDAPRPVLQEVDPELLLGGSWDLVTTCDGACNSTSGLPEPERLI